MNGSLKMKNYKTIHLKNQAGFTLIEMVAAIVLLGVMGMFSTQFITGAAQSNRTVSGQKGLLDDAKLAMEFMIREIRVANTDTGNGGAVITTPGNNSIVFTKYSGLTVDTSTQITYAYDAVADTIKRTSATAGTTTLASRVTDFSIIGNNNLYTISMTLAGPNGTNFTLESGVRPRSTL